ncbi:MAG: pseudouridine synthase [Bacteroidetes bacterium]|nr:pseudouridine synthase [Bacteroidota bacterium]
MKEKAFKYFVLYKPYGVLTQFTDKANRPTLGSLFKFPNDACPSDRRVYPVGRLDRDSEGLLLLTNDKRLTEYLLNPKNKHEREYYVQVEGIPTEKDLERLRNGIELNDGKTLPAKVKLIDDPEFPLRVPPIRERKNIPTSWISLTLVEGRNRQVRRMTAAIGFPTLRLVRVRIKNILLGELQLGKVRELKQHEIESLKKKRPAKGRL